MTLLMLLHLLLFPFILPGDEGTITNLLELVTGVFSLILFVISIYAWWTRGRQPTLIFVSFAFLLFFGKQLLELLPFELLHSELVASLFDFATLALFFLALVMRPKRLASPPEKAGLESKISK